MKLLSLEEVLSGPGVLFDDADLDALTLRAVNRYHFKPYPLSLMDETRLNQI
jgi:hypothetical protein